MCSQDVANQCAHQQHAKPAGEKKRWKKSGKNMSKQICLDYLKGKCDANRYHCKYAHPKLRENVDMSLLKTEAGQPKVCNIWVLTGYCKFGAHCRDVHPDLDTERKPKIMPPQQLKKVKNAGKSEKSKPKAPEMDIQCEPIARPTLLNFNQSNGTIEPMTPMTPMTPVTPMTSSSSGLRQMSGCVEVCGDKSMMKVNGILNKLTVAKFDPLFRDLLKLMDGNPLMTLSKVVSLVFDKAITETKEMASLYVEVCRRLFETDQTSGLTAAFMFELIHSFLLTSLSQPAEDEGAERMTRTKQIGALNVMAELYNKVMIDNQQISGVIAWLVHNTKQAEDKAMAALSVELLCSVLTSADQQLKRECPAEHSQYLLGLMSVIGGHSNRLQVLAMNVCALPPAPRPAAVQAAPLVHCPYA